MTQSTHDKNEKPNTTTKNGEVWDLYDRDKNLLGKTHLRGYPMKKGEYHIVVQLYIVNSKGEILLTKRAPEKTFPLQWEMTSGSALAGETGRVAAVRELREETGIHCEADELIYLGTQIEVDRFLMESYYLKRDVPIEDVVLQKGETVDCKWVPLDISLATDPTLVEPMRYRFLVYWKELQGIMHPERQLEPWLGWAKELQSLAQQGLAYTKDPYDEERFQQIRKIAVDIVAHKTGIGEDKVLGLFANESGYQTPKVEVRAAVFQDDKVLLVQERKTQLWSMPGGWADIGLGVGENCVKEAFEEAGAVVTSDRLIAVENRSAYDYTPYPYEIYKCYVLCALQSMDFVENTETTNAAFFDVDALPPLAKDRVTERSIRMCLEASKDPAWKVLFD